MKPEVVKFLSFVEDYSDVKTCWIWRGVLRHGYGGFALNGKTYSAHRWLYEECFGEIDPGLVLDHLCSNRACVNPEHLEPVTLAENVSRANYRKFNPEFCRNGHTRTPETTYLTINGKPGCRICRYLAQQKHRNKGKLYYVR